MKSSNRPGFWQTLPGVLTALAGVITAVAGLIVAFDQIRARRVPAPEAEQPPAVSQSSSSRQPPDSHPAAIPAETVLSAGPPNAVRFKGGDLVFSVLAARMEPFNQETRLLTISLRISNNMTSFDRSYYSELRAMADDVPQAPVDPPLEQIEAHSVKDLTYSFRLPAGVRTLALRITRMEQVGDIPFRLDAVPAK